MPIGQSAAMRRAINIAKACIEMGQRVQRAVQPGVEKCLYNYFYIYIYIYIYMFACVIKTILSLHEDAMCTENNYFFTAGFHLY